MTNDMFATGHNVMTNMLFFYIAVFKSDKIQLHIWKAVLCHEDSLPTIHQTHGYFSKMLCQALQNTLSVRFVIQP